MTKEEELFKAAEEGNIQKVKSLLNPKLLGIIKPVDVNITREDGWTLLMAAACNGHRDVLKLLIEKGAPVNAKTNDCFTPLMAAAKYGHKEIAEFFLDHGADIHAAKTGQDAGENALMFAIWQGHKDVAELLIQRGADVNAKTPTGYTAMMSAAKFGKLDIARLLFEHGADIHAVKTDDAGPGGNGAMADREGSRGELPHHQPMDPPVVCCPRWPQRGGQTAAGRGCRYRCRSKRWLDFVDTGCF